MARGYGNTEAKINAEQIEETIIKEKVVIISLMQADYYNFFVILQLIEGTLYKNIFEKRGVMSSSCF